MSLECLYCANSVDQTIRKWDIRRASRAIACFDENNTILNPTEVASDCRAHASAINGIVQTPDNRFLLSLSLDDKIRIWSLSTQQNMIVHFSGFRNKGLVPRIPTFGGYIDQNGWQYGVAPTMYVPSGGEYNNTIIGYNVRSGHTIHTLRGGLGKVRCVSNSMTDGSLYAGGDDGLSKFESGWPAENEVQTFSVTQYGPNLLQIRNSRTAGAMMNENCLAWLSERGCGEQNIIKDLFLSQKSGLIVTIPFSFTVHSDIVVESCESLDRV
jgi:WD40 repeat protein